jgi:hypothetical protein
VHDFFLLLLYARRSLPQIHQVEDYSMVCFVPLDITKPDSLEACLSHVDNAIQFGEDAEVKMPQDIDDDGDGSGAAAADVDEDG